MGAIILDVSSKDKSFILSLLKKLDIPAKEINEEEHEDLALLKAMLQGKKEKYVSKDTIMKKLKK